MKAKLFFTTILFLFFKLTFSQSSSSLNLKWVNRSPDNIGGTTQAILWDNQDENILYAGGIASGLFKSTNKGQDWKKLDSYFGNNTSICSISQSVNGDIYVGTGFIINNSNGTIYSYSFNGNGIYKSIDNGNTWTHLNQTSNASNLAWTKVFAMANHPINNDIMLVSNKNNLMLSTNASNAQPTFSNVNVVGKITDILFTTDGQEAWVTSNGAIYKSTNNTFNNYINVSPIVSASRAQIAITAVDNLLNYTVYASFSSPSGCLAGIYKSEDKGISWTQIVSPGGLDPFLFENAGCQGWYDHTLAVNPIDKNKLYIGGVTLMAWDSINGLTKIDTSNSSLPNFIPNDKHNIIFNPNDNSGNDMIVAGDGGLFFSENAYTDFPNNINFESINKNYTTLISMNSDIGENGEILISSNNKGVYYIDYTNSSIPYFAKKIYNSSNGSCNFSKYQDDVLLFGSIYGGLRKSIDNGVTNFANVDGNIDKAGCGFITCSALPNGNSCNDYSVVAGQGFFSFSYLNENSTNSKYYIHTTCGSNFYIGTNPTSTNQNPAYSSINLNSQSAIISKDGSSDGDRLVAVTSSNKVIIIDSLNYFTASVPDNTTTNTAQLKINNYLVDSLNFLVGISIDKNDKNHLLVCSDHYGGINKIAKSEDGGLTWDLIQNNLPIMPLYDCLIDKDNSNRYIVATEKGIWASNNKGDTWFEENDGLGGNIPIRRIRQEWVIEEDCNILLATSAGSGTFTCSTLKVCSNDIDEELWGWVGVENVKKNEFYLNIYPNPNSNILNFSYFIEYQSKVSISILDLTSKKIIEKNIFRSNIGKNINTINISELSKGSYYFVLTINGKKSVKLLIKR